MMKSIVVLLCLVCGLLASAVYKQTPVIGIYTQSGGDEPKDNLQAGEIQSYIAASYVKYLQMAGAQVVPIFAYKDKSYFDELLPQINGVLFPGGTQEFSMNNTWTKNADYILKYAMDQNDKGKVYPVWGTCLGLQLLAYLTSDYKNSIIESVRNQVAVTNTLRLTENKSKIYNAFSSNILNRITLGEGLFYFNHHYAITPKGFKANSHLSSFWRITTTTTSTANDEFISTMEAIKYPIFGVQYHPEKSLF